MSSAGAAALWFAWLLMVGVVGVSGVSAGMGRAPARRRWQAAGAAAYTVAALATVVALGTLGRALLAHNFAVRYVARFTSLMLDGPLAVSALWAGAPGTLLVFVTLLGVIGAVAVRWHRSHAETPVATAVLAAWSAIGLGVLCLGASPFARLAAPPAEGRGLDPQLLHRGMLWHPPLQLLGLALAAVPFAYAVAAAWPRRDDAATSGAWRGVVQRWALLAWLALTAALGSGAWWAQRQLGWFGYYFTWDPWATAPLLPWLALSVLLWVLVRDSDRARGGGLLPALVAFAGVLAVLAQVRLRDGMGASIRAVAATPAPFAVGLLAAGLVGAVLTGWAAVRRGTNSRAAARAGIGGWLTLLGALSVTVALAASPWRAELTTGLDIGQVATARDPFGASWRFTSQGLSSYQEPAYTVMAVALQATRNGHRAGLLNSQQRQYYDATDNEIAEPVTRVGSLALPWQTVTLGFLGPIDRSSAAVRISFVPLVNGLWFGAALLLLGMLLAGWPVEALARGAAPEPDRRPVASAGFCETCGAPLVSAEAHFCAECGAPVQSSRSSG